MKSQLINDTGGQRTFVLVCDPGDEAMKELLDFAIARQITAAQFTGIGAFKSLTVGYFERARKDYSKISIGEQVEVLSLVGNISKFHRDGEPKVHTHVVVGKSDGTAHGGHLLQGEVMPTLELVLVESPSHLQRRYRPEFGLALLNVGGQDEHSPGDLVAAKPT